MASSKKYLLSTLWIQYDKVISCGSNETLPNGIDFNEYAPLDMYIPEEKRSVTGCVATAISQVIFYHLMNDVLNDDISYNISLNVLTDSDAYVSFPDITAATVYISADGNDAAGTLSFNEINSKLEVFVPPPTDPQAADYDTVSLAAAEYIAAMHFTVGVLLKSTYSYIFSTGAAYKAEALTRCGFQSANNVFFPDMSEAEKSLWQTDEEQLTDEAIEILIENVANGNPVAFMIPGHAIVLDGYDQATDTFHLNYGQDAEPSNTTWYTREEFQKLSSPGFIIDISPVYQECFTVTDSRIFGTGTLLRTIQQTAAMQGGNVILFDDDLAEAEALTLPLALELKDDTTFSGFNMTLISSQPVGGEEQDTESTASVRSEEEEGGSEDKKIVTFYGGNGSRTVFDDFMGTLICNTSQSCLMAAFNFSDAEEFTITTDSAQIFAGISQYESETVLDAMLSGEVDELLENCRKKIAITATYGDDSITFDNETLVIGDLELSHGHDTLTVKGGSRIYGDIDAGNGDDLINLFSGSTVSGNLLGKTELYITLDAATQTLLFDITGSADDTLANITKLTIDATCAQAGEYLLFNSGNIGLLLDKLHISGGGGLVAASDGSIKWSASGTYTPPEEDAVPVDITIGAQETVTDAVISDGERWIFSDGSCAAGTLEIAEGGEVKVLTGAKFIFDVSGVSPDDQNGLISDYSAVNGTFRFTVKVAADQAYGTYTLAENVSEWSFSTVIDTYCADRKLGAFDDDGKSCFTYGDDCYTLRFDEERKTLDLVIDSAFSTEIKEDDSVTLNWHKPAGARGYFLELCHNENGTVKLFCENNALNIVTAHAGAYEWQVRAPGLETEYRSAGEFTIGEEAQMIDDDEEEAGSTLYQAGDDDDIADIFFSEASGVWESGYIAEHQGLPEEWDDSGKNAVQVVLAGKNRYGDIYNGAGNDDGIIYLSDSANGDALFIDDVFSAFPDENQCTRFANISEIFAGAGNDIIDLTSDKFQAATEDIIIHGGNGNDVLWAGENSCFLFGDRGNDQIIGSAQDDCISGGAGNDIIHGGGGEDIFAYGDPDTWGNDIIYQLDGTDHLAEIFIESSALEDKVLSEDFDGYVRFYVEGYENSSITLYGDRYTLSFGDDCSKIEEIVKCGGTLASSSELIFNKQSSGILA